MAIQVNDYTGQVRKAQCFTLAFHAPSEHIIEGNRFDMEMQITCEDVFENGKYVNIALLFEAERFQENQFIDLFAATALNLKKAGTKSKVTFNFEEAFKDSLTANKIDEYYTYTGSFTSPPCHHSVEWVILAKPIRISVQSLSHFQALWAGNQEFAGGSGNYRNLQVLKEETKFLKGKISDELKPTDLRKQLNDELGNENIESDEYYQTKITKYLDVLEGQKKIQEYQIKVDKKAKFLEKEIEALKLKFKQEISTDGGDTDVISDKIKEKEIELEKFLENCSEFHENSDCDIELPSSKPDRDFQDLENDDGIDDDILSDSEINNQETPKKDNQELSGNNEKEKEQILVTHDGQEIQMEIPEELEFIQTSQNSKRKLRKSHH